MIASTKACIAESIIYNDTKNTLQRCGVDDKAIDNVWIDEENALYRADDIRAVSQILPYFLTAISLDGNFLVSCGLISRGKVTLNNLIILSTLSVLNASTKSSGIFLSLTIESISL